MSKATKIVLGVVGITSVLAIVQVVALALGA